MPYSKKRWGKISPGFELHGKSVSERDRNAIYSYLDAVFDLVTWWAAEDRALAGRDGQYSC